MSWPPSLDRYSEAERSLIERLDTPEAVQRWLCTIRYNLEPRGETVRSFRGVVQHNTAHCLEAALSAAAILEHHGHPPRLLDLASADLIDHVLLAFERDGRWGAVGRSREPGLHGRKAAFRSIPDLVDSYVDPYIDDEAGVLSWALVDLRALARSDWRTSSRNVWHVEQVLIDAPHRRVHTPARRRTRVLEAYRAYKRRYPGREPVTIYEGREHWMGWRVSPGLQGKG